MDETKNSTVTQAPPNTEQRTPPPPPRAGAPPEENKESRPRVKRILIIVGVIIAAVVIWEIFFAAPKLPASIVALSGRIEGDDSAVAPKTSGKILEITVREGDTVTAGQVIARLDDAQVRAKEDQAKAALLDSQAKLQGARDQIAVLQEQLTQNQLQTGQSTMDAEGRVRQAQADLTAAEADLVQQQAALRLAEFNRDAYARLSKTGAASQLQGLQAEVQADQQAAQVASTQRKVEAARGALTTAQANLETPGIRRAQVSSTQAQIAQQQSTIAAAKAQTAQAQATLAQAQADRSDLTVVAPFSGTVLTRAAEPGEVVQAGTAIVTLLDLSKVYLRGFVPEGDIGKVKIGQPAHIFLDSNTKQSLDGYVLRIDPQATFTPENTYFRDDRVKQVVGVKVQLTQGIGYAKPGMPADGEILTSGNAWPPHKRAAQ
ncbi:MAG TPA: HlyD family efflux transporter periplasmic adaptor subunit [Candidatus Acidoferrales bacterium]|jgi:HlyD family secretion protein|nr:HlyD family efflux transporter periplasmic adaptor subunit [Candidatus Acidoferrales bacterium]